MRDLRRIDVLLNENTDEEFHKGDIVKIKTYSNEYIGRIDCIETLDITIDTSKEYKSIRNTIEYDNIINIERYK